MKKPFLLLFLFLLIFLVGNANANPIQFIYTGVASGTYQGGEGLGGGEFYQTLFTITAYSDTIYRQDYNEDNDDNPDYYYYDHYYDTINPQATISIGSISGAFNPITSSTFYLSDRSVAFGFYDSQYNYCGDLFAISWEDDTSPIPADWLMMSSLEEVTGTGEIYEDWGGGPSSLSFTITTDDGEDILLDLSLGSCVGTYQATVTSAPVPEPATMLLLGSGLVGLAGFGRRKFKN